MTLPYERYNAVIQTRQFLWDLMLPAVTPRVSREVRERARALLKHFPLEMEMEVVCDMHKMGDHFQPIFSKDVMK